MSFTNKYQQDVDKRTSQFKEQYFSQEKMLEKITEELEEVKVEATKIETTQSINDKEIARKRLGEEIVDLLFSAMCLANANKVNIDEEREEMMTERRYGRDNNRFEKKE